MGEGVRPPEGGLAETQATDGGAATLPGVGSPAAQLETLRAPGDAAHLETLPAAANAGIASEPTLAAGHGATLPGPFTVADLPTLPRIDDASYAIGVEIARGGMGKILAARDRKLRRDVVIKVTRRDSGHIDPRFEREALITARLQHPSIVRVYDAGVLGDGRAFYAMERVRGRSLEVVIAEAKTLQQRLALLPHAIAISDAMAYAHSENVVHRDLKPQNVLIGPFGETVVIDWGLAKDIGSDDLPVPATGADDSGSSSGERSPSGTERSGSGPLTEHGAVLGTPSYMAPEQARGEPSDDRSDVYALGALLYTMLSGQPPHRGATTDEVLRQVAAGTHTPIGEREPGLPRELATLVEHAMAHDPAKRLPSAKELADELRRFTAGKLLASHTYSIGHLIKRWIARHRVVLAVAALAIVLLAVGGALAVKNVLLERDIAQTERRKAATAEEIATRRYDDLVHDQARGALPDDPSRAAAWLRQLTDRALDWPKTYDLIADAAQRGLARELRGHLQDVELVAVSPDGTHLATGSDDSTARWWNLADETSRELRGHTGPIDTMTLSPDGKYLATAGTDHDVWLWELGSGIGRKLSAHQNTVRGVAFSPDSTRLASSSEDGTLYLWDVSSATGHLLLKHSYGLRPVLWADNETLVVGGFDGTLGWIATKAEKPGKMRPAHAAEIRCLALSPDRKYLVSGDEDGLVTLWRGQTRVRTLGHHVDVVRDVVFTADGKLVVSAGGDDIVRVYPIPDGEAIDLLGNKSGVKDIDVSPDGTRVASAGIDGVVRIWTIRDRSGLLIGGAPRELVGHGDAVKAVAFTRDDRLISGAEDNHARIWRLGELEPPPHGVALRDWIAVHTNVEVRAIQAPK